MPHEIPAGDTAVTPKNDVTTGDTHVDEALRALEGLSEKPLSEHASVIDQVHQQLRHRLGNEAS